MPDDPKSQEKAGLSEEDYFLSRLESIENDLRHTSTYSDLIRSQMRKGNVKTAKESGDFWC